MKQLEKKDLKIGDIFVAGKNYNFINKEGTPFSIHKNKRTGHTIFCKTGGFMYDNIRMATSEEKHWLEKCIKENKFISYDEAMKTFIPEYVEAISNRHSNSEIIGTIYKTSELPKWVKGHKLERYWKEYMFHYKPSTKEAYDAQFVVKEPEFVLPEKWCVKHSNETLKWIKKNAKYNGNSIRKTEYYNYPEDKEGNNSSYFIEDGYTEITFEQFKKYVLKEDVEVLEEPKDKVLLNRANSNHNSQTLTISKVESSEGAIYQLGDKITVFTKDSKNKGKVFTIKSFRWNNAKTNICAITELHSKNGIGLDKIELFQEPIVKELSLLEQAKLKYPIGTKVISANKKTNKIRIIKSLPFTFNNEIRVDIEQNNDNYKTLTLYKNNTWAEIIIDDFKLPEKWQIKRTEENHEIINNWMNNHHKDKIIYGTDYNSSKYFANNFNLSKIVNKEEGVIEITFEQFEQHVLHNGFKIGDRFNKVKSLLNHTAPYPVNEREIIDLQYINGQSVTFYKVIETSYSGPQCRILTKNIVK